MRYVSCHKLSRIYHRCAAITLYSTLDWKGVMYTVFYRSTVIHSNVM